MRSDHNVPITVDIVVESQLFIFLDVSTSKDSHTNVLPDGPFGNIAIRVTTVIGKSADASSFRSVYKLQKADKPKDLTKN
jgi:hypothetical protein